MWSKFQLVYVLCDHVDICYLSMQASPTEEDTCCTAPQGVEKAALCECAVVLNSYPSCLKSEWKTRLYVKYLGEFLPTSLWLIIFQHGTGRRAGLQHLSDESEWPQPFRWPSEPPPERGTAAKHHTAGGRRRSLCQPRPDSHREWVARKDQWFNILLCCCPKKNVT